MKHVIALDVGGTRLKAALVGINGELLCEDQRDTIRELGPKVVMESILEFAAELRAHGERRFGEAASAAGVAVPGIIDVGTGTAVYAANLGWRDVPLRSLLVERLGGIPVALGHDVRTGGLAERRIGAGQGIDRFLFLALGTGISGAIGLGDHIEAGAGGLAGEIGHIVIREGGLQCACGQQGCLEQYASASAVGRAWAAVSGGPDARDCVRALEARDDRASAVWEDAVTALADGLVTAITLLNPRTVIIGGGLAEAGETLFTPLRTAVQSRLTFQQLPDIVPALLGGKAGCLGAGLMAWDLLNTLAG
ncbi:ROK family protein [Streptomyces sp. NPDC048639]|uniref:ROK family protein n=1 Tax=Streptomyces sp. NPDC048639 TaxID=3365581 RepID=UPI00371B87AD